MLTEPAPIARMTAVAFMCCSCASLGPVAASEEQAPAANVWQAEKPAADFPQARAELKGESRVVRLDKAALDAVLRNAPKEDPMRRDAGVVIALPMPDGTFSRFRVVESSIVAPELAAQFPELRTYSGQGLDDTTATTRFGWTQEGFHAIVLGLGGSVYIDRYSPNAPDYYVSYRKAK
jgi:hypothetical protein